MDIGFGEPNLFWCWLSRQPWEVPLITRRSDPGTLKWSQYEGQLARSSDNSKTLSRLNKLVGSGENAARSNSPSSSVSFWSFDSCYVLCSLRSTVRISNPASWLWRLEACSRQFCGCWPAHFNEVFWERNRLAFLWWEWHWLLYQWDFFVFHHGVFLV